MWESILERIRCEGQKPIRREAKRGEKGRREGGGENGVPKYLISRKNKGEGKKGRSSDGKDKWSNTTLVGTADVRRAIRGSGVVTDSRLRARSGMEKKPNGNRGGKALTEQLPQTNPSTGLKKGFKGGEKLTASGLFEGESSKQDCGPQLSR